MELKENSTLNDTPQSQKRKRAQRRPWGCLRVLLIPVLLAVACYGGMWLFARYGAKTALGYWFPIPPNAEEIIRYDWPYSLEWALYTEELYEYKGSTQELVDWYSAQGFSVLDTGDSYMISYTIAYDAIPGMPETPLLSLYKISVKLTSNYSSPVYCSKGDIFKTHDTVPEVKLRLADVPRVDLTGRDVVFRRMTCWPIIK